MKITKTTLIIGILLAIVVYAIAGSLDPNDPPAPTMRTLDEVYNEVHNAGTGVLQREGYYKYFTLNPSHTLTAFVVPLGKKFVLLQTYTRINATNYHSWRLLLNSGVILSGEMCRSGEMNNIETENGKLEFPDRCITFGPGDHLEIENIGDDELSMTIIGYFYDI